MQIDVRARPSSPFSKLEISSDLNRSPGFPDRRLGDEGVDKLPRLPTSPVGMAMIMTESTNGTNSRPCRRKFIAIKYSLQGFIQASAYEFQFTSTDNVMGGYQSALN